MTFITWLIVWFLLTILVGIFIFKMHDNKIKKWKNAFTALLIANTIFAYFALAYLHIGSYMWAMNFIVVSPLSAAFIVIDLVALFTYIFRGTRGMTKVFLYAVLLPLILLIIILSPYLIFLNFS